MQTLQALSLDDITNLYDNGTAIIKEYSNLYKRYQSREVYLSDLIHLNVHESLSDFADQKINEIDRFDSYLNQAATWDQFIDDIESFYNHLQVDSNNRIRDNNHYLYNLIEVETMEPLKNDIHLASITEHYSMDEFITLLNDSIHDPITTNNGIKSHTFITGIFI